MALRVRALLAGQGQRPSLPAITLPALRDQACRRDNLAGRGLPASVSHLGRRGELAAHAAGDPGDLSEAGAVALSGGTGAPDLCCLDPQASDGPRAVPVVPEGAKAHHALTAFLM